MNTDTVTLVIAIAGIALAALQYLILVFRSINAAAYNHQLLKLLTAGNRDRAIKLSNAASMAPYGRITRAMLERSTELGPDDGRGLVAEAVREVLASESRRELAGLRRTGLLAVAAIGCALAAAVVGSTYGAGVASTFGMPAMIAILVLGGWSMVQRRARIWAQHGEDLCAPLVDYVMNRGDGGASSASE